MQFELFRPGQVVVNDYYAELPIAIKVTGKYHDMGAFAADVANLSRIVTLHNMNISSPRDATGFASRWRPRRAPTATSTQPKLRVREAAKKAAAAKNPAKPAAPAAPREPKNDETPAPGARPSSCRADAPRWHWPVVVLTSTS